MHITFQRSNKDPTFKFTLQDFLHSNQKLKDKVKLYISSQQWNNNRLLLFQSISDMRNPNNGKSFLQGRIKIFKIRMNQGIKNTPRGRPGKCMFLCDFDWQLAIKHPKTYQSELPSIKCTVVFAKQTMAACRFILSPPPPYFDTSTSP